VFHLAAHGAYSWQRDAGTIFRVNTLGTVTLLDACAVAGFEAFVQAGSSSEYGLKDHAPAETEALDPNSAYAVSKAAATMYGRQVALSRRLPITTLRLYSAYGPYEDAKRLMPTVVREGLAHRLPALADAMIARDYVHVDDVCDAFILAAEAKPRRSGAIYNVGTGVQTTLREVVELVRSKLGITALPEWNSMPARDWDTVTWQSDPRLIREELGWVAQRDLSRGLDEFIAWTRDHPGVTGHSRS
jgi:dolichol-phosphate mannosyltransferase